MRQREWKREFRRLIDSGKAERMEGDEEAHMGLFLGTVFSLMPSGKYYMPFACSNVTKAEAERDERERERMESAANELGAWLESGEGSLCDIFLCWAIPEFKPTEEILAIVKAKEFSLKCIKDSIKYENTFARDYYQQEYRGLLRELLFHLGLMGQ